MTTSKKSTFDRWTNMDMDILIRIFMTLDVMELLNVSYVCKFWQTVASQPCFWEVLDLSKINARNYNPMPQPFNHMAMQLLSRAHFLCRGSITCLIFHHETHITNQDLNFISDRTPNLKRLAMPFQDDDLLLNDCESAAMKWPKLESLTISGDYFSNNFMQAIGQHCKNLAELKLLCEVDKDAAEIICANASHVKVLSLECNMVYRDALLVLLKGLWELEEVSLFHCHILEPFVVPGYMSVLFQLDSDVLQESSRLNKFRFSAVGPHCLAWPFDRTPDNEVGYWLIKVDEDAIE